MNNEQAFHETFSKLPMREYERRTFSIKRFLKNEHLQ